VREVAYETLTKAERGRRHSTVAGWLSKRVRELDREDEELEQLAHHYGAAAELVGELGPVDGVPADITQLAVDALERAAHRAEQRDLHLVAVHFLDDALRLGDAGSRRSLLLARAASLAALHETERARADLAEAQSDAESAGDLTSIARSLTVLGNVLQREGDFEHSASVLQDAVAAWSAAGDQKGEAEALRRRGMAFLLGGQSAQAETPISLALEMSRQMGDRRGQAWALQNLAWIKFNQGDLLAAEERLNESMLAFADSRDYGGLGWALGLLGWVRFQQGRLTEAESLATQILDELRETGDRWATAMIVMLMANIRLWQGRIGESIERAHEARQLFVEMNDVLGQFRSMVPEVRGLAAAGRADEALARVEQAIELSGGPAEANITGILPSLAGQLGDPSLAARAHAEATSFDDVLAAPMPGKGPEELAVHFALLDLQSGDPDAALRRLLSEPPELPAPGSQSPFAAGVLALALVGVGRAAEADAFLEPVLAEGSRATYADRIDALVARGLASAALGHREEADAAFASASELADATDDVLRQGLARLAAAHGTGGPSALADARSRLCESGVTAEGWDTAYSLGLRS
ncbi:MAG: hypothetical protein QOD49_2863, partial [Actinomycetota bacterium]|nr:hypothetical protein [Actinomycetota bacterium]